MGEVDLSFVKETIRLNESRLADSSYLVDDLLSDDALLALGYNKRKNFGIQHSKYEQYFQWRISIGDENRLIIHITSLNDEDCTLDTEQNTENYKYVLVTNFIVGKLYNGESKEELFEIRDEKDWSLISFEGFDGDKIASKYNETLINLNKIHQAIIKKEVIESILRECNTHITESNIEKSKLILEEVFDTTSSLQRENAELKVYIDKHKINSTDDNDTKVKYESVLNNLRIEQDKSRLLESSICEYERQIADLKKKLNDISGVTEETEWNKLESDYRQQISELTLEALKYKEEVDRLNEQLKEIKETQISDNTIQKNIAKSLVDAIEDDPDSERVYVGAINKKLFQSKDLGKFIGICISELYEIVQYKLLQIIYDGNMFKFIQPAKIVHFTINNKDYQIDFSDETEQSIIGKMKELFNVFSIAFEVKLIGKENTHYSENKEEENEVEHQIEVEEQEEQKESLELPLSNLGEIAWTDGVEIESIDYISKHSNNTHYNVSSDTSDINKMLIKSIDALLSLSDNFEEAIKRINTADLSEISGFIARIDSDNRIYPRISLSKYVITPIDNIAKCVPILTGIADLIGENSDNILIRLTAKHNNKINEQYLNITSIVENETGLYKKDIDTDKTFDCVILGNISDYVILTKTSLEIQKQLFNEASAIKTNQFICDTSNFEGKKQAIVKVCETSNTDLNTDLIGNVLGENYRILSLDEEEVSEEHYELSINDQVYYVSIMAEWQFIYAIIKLHTIMTKNKLIGIKCKLNQDVFEYYNSEFKTSEPSLMLAIKSLTEYINSRTK